MLLNGPIKNDHRVIKMINSLSKKAIVELYYINGEDADKLLLNKTVKLYSIELNNKLKRTILSHSFFCFEFNIMIKKILKQKKTYDYVWANDLPTLYPAYKVAKKHNSKLIYDSHEIYLETLNQFFTYDKNIIKNIIIYLILKLMKIHGQVIEKKCIKKTNTLITVNESLKNYFMKKYNLNNCISIMNFPIQKIPGKQNVDFRKKFNWKASDKILIYQGTINKGRGLEILIESFYQLSDKYKLIILGNGSLKNFLVKKIEKNKIQHKIKFLDAVPLNELLKFTSGADIGVNLLEDINLSKKLASPNKLFEYIHAGIPVLCSYSIENKKVISKYKVGELTSNIVSDILKNIKKIEENGIEYYKKSLNVAVVRYSWINQESEILKIIN